jgi:taurine dioxygenase
MTKQTYQIEPIAGALGAEISGIDLSKPLSSEAFDVLHQALVEYEVIFFRDQDITPEQQRDMGLLFGSIKPHPAYPHPDNCPEVTILEHSAEKPSKIERWHTDMTFMEKPPLGSILLAKIVPPRGGDTLWASMSAAYEALSDKMKRFLSDLRAVHDFRYGFKESLAEPGGQERLRQAIIDNPPISHPLIRTHPVTGKKLLFVNRLFTTHIEDMKPSESTALLQMLYEHAASPEFTCRFRWKPNSLAFWDNRSTQHKPVNDHGLGHRVHHRVTIEGDRPV